MARARFKLTCAIALCPITLLIVGCGFSVNSPDLFLLKRSGQGLGLSLLVNDSGTVRCNGGRPRQLSDPLLIRARDVAIDLGKDAKAKLQFTPSPRSVFSYSVRLQDGTISFPDTAAAGHVELARAEQFALEVAHGPCRLAG